MDSHGHCTLEFERLIVACDYRVTNDEISARISTICSTALELQKGQQRNGKCARSTRTNAHVVDMKETTFRSDIQDLVNTVIRCD